MLELESHSKDTYDRALHAPTVIGTSAVLPEHRYTAAELGLVESAPVEERYFAMDAERLTALGDFQDRNDFYIAAAADLGERALVEALADADVAAGGISAIVTTSVTGIATPSLDARLMNRIDFDPSLVRMPLFGLGCLGGAAGIARVADWLRAYPHKCAVLLAVELCSLASQSSASPGSEGSSVVSGGLFGDGAAAVVMAGAEHPLASHGGRSARVRVVDSSSIFFPNTEDTIGWDVDANGFTVVLSPEVPGVVLEHAGPGVGALLARNGLLTDDIGNWVMHPGDANVIDALEDSLRLGRGTLTAGREHLRSVGNIASVSVLFLLDEQRRRYAPGDGSGPYGVLMAFGPAFCAEILLLRFEGASCR